MQITIRPAYLSDRETFGELGPTGSVFVLTGVSLAVALAATVSPAVRHAPRLPAREETPLPAREKAV